MAIEKGLLLHWWHYYGKCIYTLAEIEEFEKIIDDYGVEKVLDAAISSYVCGDGSPTIVLMSIRNNKVKELFDALPDINKMEEKEKENYLNIKEKFIETISQTAK